MHSPNNVSSKLKFLTSTLRDTSDNLKSLDNLIQHSPPRSLGYNDFRSTESLRSSNNGLNRLNGTTKSLTKIEQSLEDILEKQNNLDRQVKRVSLSRDVGSAEIRANNRPSENRAASMNGIDLIGVPGTDASKETTLTVDKKLREAQETLRNSRIALEQRSSMEKGNLSLVSVDLKSALDNRTSSEPQNGYSRPNRQLESTTRRLAQVEGDNSTFKFELESTERLLSQERAAKTAFVGQMEASEKQCNRMETEVTELRRKLEREVSEAQIAKKRAEVADRLQERCSVLQRENDQLRLKSGVCSHGREIEELRAVKEAAERKASSLNDQLQESQRQLDARQSHVDHLLAELASVQSEAGRTESQLRDSKGDGQKQHRELHQQQQRLMETGLRIESLERTNVELEVTKNSGFATRDDEIERCTSQGNRMRSDIDKLNVHLEENGKLLEEMQKENEALRQKLAESGSQTELLRKEMESLIEARSIQDELLRRRDQENQELSYTGKEMKLELECAKRETERGRCESEVYAAELAEARENRAVLRVQLDTALSSGRDHSLQLQALRTDYSASQRRLQNSENQLEVARQQLTEAQSLIVSSDNSRQQIEQYQADQESVSERLLAEKERREREREVDLTGLREMLDAEREAARVLMNKTDRQMREIHRLHEEVWARDLGTEKAHKKTSQLRQEIDDMRKDREVEKSLTRCGYEELLEEKHSELGETREKMERLVEERDQIMRWIIVDVDGLADVLRQHEVLTGEGTQTQLRSSTYLLGNSYYDLATVPASASALSALGGLDISRCFLELKTRLSWIRAEVNRALNHLQNHRLQNEDLKEEIARAQQRLQRCDEERREIREIEVEEAKKCLLKLKSREKNEANIQVKCNRLQEELQYVRGYLNSQISSCHSNQMS